MPFFEALNMLIPFLFSLLLTISLAGPLNKEENAELQAICGKFGASPPSRAAKRAPESMGTPNATRFEAPFTVAFRHTHSSSEDPTEVIAASSASCTGTLISPRHVATAAHCITTRDCYNGNKPPATILKHILESFIVVPSTVCQNEGNMTCDSAIPEQFIRPVTIFLARSWQQCNGSVMRGDFAVIELEKDIKLSETVQPACLNTVHPHPGTKMLMYGYGRVLLEEAWTSGVLRKMTTTVVTRKECQKHSYFSWDNSYDVICSRSPNQIACKGDSGSGEVVIRGNKAYLTGILSYGPPCQKNLTAEGIMDFSSSTISHNSWVAAATGINPGPELSDKLKQQLKKEYHEYSKND